MTRRAFFPKPPEAALPKIYAYILPNSLDHEGYIKIGYTERDPIERIDEQTRSAGVKYIHILTEYALRPDGTSFRDSDVHAVLKRNGFPQMKDAREWFKCSLDDVKRAVIAVRERTYTLTDRIEDFKMRKEQSFAVRKTYDYFTNSPKPAKFLWNAKMRFGKTFTAYQLCRRMKLKKILVLTFKPAVESSWSDDILRHKDFEGWQFVSNHSAELQGISIDSQFDASDMSRPVVVFGSFQDLLGTNSNGGIKAKNEFIHSQHWDIVILDEYHFGAWRDNARKLFMLDDEAEADFDPEKYRETESANTFHENILPITSDYYLYLSGTPFRALNSGEFIEEQIYSWTYSDEQRAKEKWKASYNPYEAMPRIVMMTYKIPESIRKAAQEGEFDGFDLNVFFSTDDKGRFVYEDEVRKWLLLIRGAYMPFEHEQLKAGRKNKPPLPYSDSRLLRALNHTLWFLPDVASCNAMYELLNNDVFFREYKIVLCAGSSCGNGIEALEYLNSSITDPLREKSITLSCGKLTTGVTVRPWSGILMLRNLKSPETYFQAAFRVQSPWTMYDEFGEQIILKPECYIFDFALDRALKQIADYSCRLNISSNNPEKKVQEFMNFLPVLAYDGSVMKEIDALDVLDFTISGTSATLLARRWQSSLLVNVDNDTLKRILDNPEALKAIMKIYAFRALNKDIETIINTTSEITRARNDDNPQDIRKITEEEKKNNKLRKEIQEKLIKFATRVPPFMYLTDEREHTLQDVITQIAPDLFRSVTGLTMKDFELLCSLGVFNEDVMNGAIYNFKRYEDSSLDYTGLTTHNEKLSGGWNTVKARGEEVYFFEE